MVDRIGHPSLRQSHSSGHPKSHQKLICQEVFFSWWMKTNKRTSVDFTSKNKGNVSNPLFLPTWCVLKKKHKRIPHPIGSMVLLYMVTWIPSIYPLHVSIYTSTMDPMGTGFFLAIQGSKRLCPRREVGRQLWAPMASLSAWHFWVCWRRMDAARWCPSEANRVQLVGL